MFVDLDRDKMSLNDAIEHVEALYNCGADDLPREYHVACCLILEAFLYYRDRVKESCETEADVAWEKQFFNGNGGAR